MKVSELRPCDSCSGSIAPSFYVVRVSLALIKPQAVNEFFGMHQFFGGKAGPALIENFAPASLDAVTIAGDKEPSLMTELTVGWPVHFLEPIDVMEQFIVANDAVAAELLELAVRCIVDGQASPDQDWRRWWADAVKATAQHFNDGTHPIARPS